MSLPEFSGIEPDFCFYIENWQAVVGKKRINWEFDPPPDLVIEVDVTSYTDINDYLPDKVPEIWLLKNRHLLVYRLQGENYVNNAMCNLFLEPLSKPLPHRERGFDSCSPSLQGKGLGVRFERKLHTALITESSYFPNVSEIVRQCLQIATEQTTSHAIRWLRGFLQG